ncbi:hypothetical protein [Vibrio sp. 1731]|uniref:hypothetical protein n=1 Tax=Vibrio sp. 1731 TaxID=3074573 RepID=UPI002964608C|nr:hypothetical protein [Vibrio sp. 1731]
MFNQPLLVVQGLHLAITRYPFYTRPTIFGGWPYAFFRTLMFVRLIVQPSSGKKRKLPNISREVPEWYRYLSILLLGIIIVNSVIVALTLSIGAILLAIE